MDREAFLRAEIVHLKTEIERLRAALEGAIGDLETWATDEGGELRGDVESRIERYRKLLNQQSTNIKE